MSQTLSALRACRTSPWLGLEGQLGVDIRTCPLSYLLRQHQLTPWCLSRPWMLCPEAGESWGRIEVGGVSASATSSAGPVGTKARDEGQGPGVGGDGQGHSGEETQMGGMARLEIAFYPQSP